MYTIPTDAEPSRATEQRAGELLRAHQQSLHQHTDRLFAGLMFLQWLAGIAAAYWISPRTWAGTVSQTHLHVWAAVFFGGAISACPSIWRCSLRPLADAARDRRRTDPDVGSADSPDRRADRDALPRVRIARVFRLLSRLARAVDGDAGHGGRPLLTRHVLAPVGLRGAHR